MSFLIQAVAYFLMETADSGRVVLPNGDVAFELFSKEAAFRALQNALGNGLIDEAERKILRQQIDDSPLPDRLSRTARQLHHIEDALEELYQLIEEEPEDPMNDGYSSKAEDSQDDVDPLGGKTTIH